MSAGAAIAALAEKGVTVKTGDNKVITRKICREVALDPGQIVLGTRVEQMTDDELADRRM
jgi:Mg2+-importing ATPase